MRVVFIAHSSHMGGAERYLLEVLAALRSQIEAMVIAPSEGPFTQHLNALDIPYTIINYQWWVSPFHPFVTRTNRTLYNWLKRKKVKTCIQAWNADVVFTNTFSVNVGAYAARELGIPHLWNIHEYGIRDHGLVFDCGEAEGYRRIHQLSTTVLVNSKALMEHVTQFIPKEQCKLIYNSCDIQAPERYEETISSEERLTFLLMGGVHPGKGQLDAVLALATYRQLGGDARLVLLGKADAHYLSCIHAAIREHHLEGWVEHVDHVADPTPYLKQAHVVLMCSRCEAFGRVTVEAMKFGKPVIGSDAGGTTELIQAGKTGYLYPPGDCEALAAHMVTLQDDTHRETLGRAAHQWAHDTFTPDICYSPLLTFFKEAISCKCCC